MPQSEEPKTDPQRGATPSPSQGLVQGPGQGAMLRPISRGAASGCIAYGLLFAYLAVVYHSPSRAYILVHDNLDSIVAMYKLLVDRGMMFAGLDATVPGVMGGLPRNCLPSEANLGALFYAFASPPVAFAINEALVRVISLAGAYLFISRVAMPGVPPPLAWGLALGFALLPFYPTGYLAVMGLPLLAWAFTELRRKGASAPGRSGASRAQSEPRVVRGENNDRTSRIALGGAWAAMIVYPVYANLVAIGFAVIPVMWAIAAWDTAVCYAARSDKKGGAAAGSENEPSIAAPAINTRLLAALAVFTVLHVLSEYRLFYQVLFQSDFVSHRVEFGLIGRAESLRAVVMIGLDNFANGQYHAHSLQNPIILAVVGFALAMSARGRAARLGLIAVVFIALVALEFRVPHLLPFSRRWAPRINVLVYAAIAAACAAETLLAFVRGAGSSPGAATENSEKAARKQVRIILALLAFNAIASTAFALHLWPEYHEFLARARLHFLTVFNTSRIHWLHPISWMLAFGFALGVLRVRMRWGGPLVAILLAAQVGHALWFCEAANERRRNEMTFEQFYSAELLGEIEEFIGRPKDSYRVASFAMHPSIAMYYGFETIDGYFYNYPVAAKRRFRPLIAAELAKSERMKQYFDDWGSRCYIFSHDLQLLTSQTKMRARRSVETLDLDAAAFAELGGEYILSAVEIQRPEETGLVQLALFESPDSPWIIRLYQFAEPSKPDGASR